MRRELRTKPGDLFNKEALTRSAREIASMGFFDPEKVVPDIKPNYEDGTVDVNWQLEQKSNDQLEFSLGWGQTGIIGKIGIKFNNFSIRNLFGKNKLHRGILPYGDGEQLGFSFQTNGSYTVPTGLAASVLTASISVPSTRSSPTSRATIATTRSTTTMRCTATAMVLTTTRS